MGNGRGGKLKKAQLKAADCALGRNPSIPLALENILGSVLHHTTKDESVNTSMFSWYTLVFPNCQGQKCLPTLVTMISSATTLKWKFSKRRWEEKKTCQVITAGCLRPLFGTKKNCVYEKKIAKNIMYYLCIFRLTNWMYFPKIQLIFFSLVGSSSLSSRSWR